MFVSLNFYPLNTRKHSDECTNKYVLLMMRIGVGLSLLMLTLCTSCTREVLSTDAANFGSDYFPLAIGHTIEYSVDSLKYNTFTRDTDFVHVLFKDEIVSEFTDNTGRDSYAIERSVRSDSNAAWQGQLTYYATRGNYQIEVVENNLRFIKLVFPVNVNTTWKGNVYIPSSTSNLDELKWYYDWDYTYSNINQDFDNGEMNVPNSMVVSYEQLTNDSTAKTQYSNYTNYKESYARTIGLTYRELTHWEYQPTEGFRNGFSVVMRATKYQ